jgi:hypothetical protein
MRYLALIAALTLCLLAAGCATGGPGSARTSTATAPPIDVNITKITPYASDNQYMQPDAGYRYVKVDFSIRNNGATGFDYSPVRVALRDPAGYSYSLDKVSFTVPGSFRQQVIPPGQQAAGVLVFPVPTSLARDAVLTLRVW